MGAFTLAGSSKGAESSPGTLYEYVCSSHMQSSGTQKKYVLECKNHHGQNDEYYFLTSIFMPAGTLFTLRDSPILTTKSRPRRGMPPIIYSFRDEPYLFVRLLKADIVFSIELTQDNAIKYWVQDDDGKRPAVHNQDYHIVEQKPGRLGGKVSIVTAEFDTQPLANSPCQAKMLACEEAVNYLDVYQGFHKSNSPLVKGCEPVHCYEWENANGNNYRQYQPAWDLTSQSTFSAVTRLDHNKSTDWDDHAVFAYLFDQDLNIISVYQAIHPASSVGDMIVESCTYIRYGATALTIGSALTPEPIVSKIASAVGLVAAFASSGVGKVASIFQNQLDTGGFIAFNAQAAIRSAYIMEAAARVSQQRIQSPPLAIELKHDIEIALATAFDNFPDKGSKAIEFNARDAQHLFGEKINQAMAALGDHNYRIYRPEVHEINGRIHIVAKIDHIRGTAKDDYASIHMIVKPEYLDGNSTQLSNIVIKPPKIKFSETLIGKEVASFIVFDIALSVVPVSKLTSKIHSKINKDFVRTVGDIVEPAVVESLGYGLSEVYYDTLDNIPNDRRHFIDLLDLVQKRFASLITGCTIHSGYDTPQMTPDEENPYRARQVTIGFDAHNLYWRGDSGDTKNAEFRTGAGDPLLLQPVPGTDLVKIGFDTHKLYWRGDNGDTKNAEFRSGDGDLFKIESIAGTNRCKIACGQHRLYWRGDNGDTKNAEFRTGEGDWFIISEH